MNKPKPTLRRTFTTEFKAEAVRLVFEEGQPISEVARDLDIHQNLIYKWRDELATKGEGAFPGRGRGSAPGEEIRRLKRKLAAVSEERDILKKAVTIFSRTPHNDTDS